MLEPYFTNEDTGYMFKMAWDAATKGSKWLQKQYIMEKFEKLDIVKLCDEILAIIPAIPKNRKERSTLNLSLKLMNGAIILQKIKVDNFLDELLQVKHIVQRPRIPSRATSNTSPESPKISKKRGRGKRVMPVIAPPLLSVGEEDIRVAEGDENLHPLMNEDTGAILESNIQLNILEPPLTPTQFVLAPGDDFGGLDGYIFEPTPGSTSQFDRILRLMRDDNNGGIPFEQIRRPSVESTSSSLSNVSAQRITCEPEIHEEVVREEERPRSPPKTRLLSSRTAERPQSDVTEVQSQITSDQIQSQPEKLPVLTEQESVAKHQIKKQKDQLDSVRLKKGTKSRCLDMMSQNFKLQEVQLWVENNLGLLWIDSKDSSENESRDSSKKRVGSSSTPSVRHQTSTLTPIVPAIDSDHRSIPQQEEQFAHGMAPDAIVTSLPSTTSQPRSSASLQEPQQTPLLSREAVPRNLGFPLLQSTPVESISSDPFKERIIELIRAWNFSQAQLTIDDLIPEPKQKIDAARTFYALLILREGYVVLIREEGSLEIERIEKGRLLL